MKESVLSVASQKLGAAKRIVGWMTELERLRALKLADLKEIRHEIAGLEKKLREGVSDEQMDLFPGADVAPPKTLDKRDNIWTLLVCRELTLRVFRLDLPAEPEPASYFEAAFSETAHKWLRDRSLPRRLVVHLAGTPEQAKLDAVERIFCLIDDQDIDGRAKRLRKRLQALADELRPTPPPPPVEADAPLATDAAPLDPLCDGDLVNLDESREKPKEAAGAKPAKKRGNPAKKKG